METPKITMAELQGKDGDELREIVLDLAEQVRERDRLIAELRELIRLRTAVRYVPSTEQMESLFPELEALAAPGPEDEKSPVEAHLRKKPKARTALCTAPAGTPVLDIRHDGDAPDSYFRDGDKIIDKIAFVPRRLVAERHHWAQYRVDPGVEDCVVAEARPCRKPLDRDAFGHPKRLVLRQIPHFLLIGELSYRFRHVVFLHVG